MDIKAEKDFLNEIVEHFYIEYGDNTVSIDQMPYPRAVNFWMMIQPKDASKTDVLKQRLAKYGIKAEDDMLDGATVVRFAANHDDEFMSVLGEVLQQRGADAKVNVFKRAQKKLAAALKNTKMVLSRAFGGKTNE